MTTRKIKWETLKWGNYEVGDFIKQVHFIHTFRWRNVFKYIKLGKSNV